MYRSKAASEYDSLREALDDFAWVLLAHFHAGFENNDGGYGTITIDATGRVVTLNHNDRVIEAVNTYTEADMAHPYHHALSSVQKWGGIAEDYLSLHLWFDESKAIIADFRHRALRHHAEGIFMPSGCSARR